MGVLCCQHVLSVSLSRKQPKANAKSNKKKIRLRYCITGKIFFFFKKIPNQARLQEEQIGSGNMTAEM